MDKYYYEMTYRVFEPVADSNVINMGIYIKAQVTESILNEWTFDNEYKKLGDNLYLVKNDNGLWVSLSAK